MSRHARLVIRALLVALAVVVIAVAGAADADAGKRKKRSKKKPNMPDGWSWPPTSGMKQAGKACMAKLDELGVTWKKGRKTKKIATPVVVPDMTFGGVVFKPTFRKPPFTMDCHLAVGLVTHGQALYDLGVRVVKFSSIYRYDTHISAHGKREKKLSRHSLGLAVDIRAFVDAAGNEASVLDDYNDGNALLLDIEQYLNESGAFRTVLTPRNDPHSHDDHFHIEVKVDYHAPAGKPKKKKRTS